MPSIPRIDKQRLLFYAPKSLTDGWRLRGFVEAPKLTVGRWVPQLQRVTLNFERRNEDSEGPREFIESDLLDFAHDNPSVAVYVQPVRRRRPVLVAEYLNGRQAWLNCAGFTRKQMNFWINYLRTRSGERIVTLDMPWRTGRPSVQGVWSPFLYQPTEMAVAGWPAERFSRHRNAVPTATEKLLELLRAERLANLHMDDSEPADVSPCAHRQDAADSAAPQQS